MSRLDLKLFAKRRSATQAWMLFGVQIPDSEIESAIKDVQVNMKSAAPFYAHFYDDRELIVVFKERVFKVAPHSSSWEPVVEFGKQLRISDAQLDFWPNRFQDEVHYFGAADFLPST